MSWLISLTGTSCCRCGRGLGRFSFRYAKDGGKQSAVDLEFGDGRVSNATVETYFRTVKHSVLKRTTNLRPTDFLTHMYKHTLSRYKGDLFGVSQSSHGRQKVRDAADDLNVEDKWQRRGRSTTKRNRRACYFTDNLSRTNACRLSSVTSFRKH